MVRDMKLPLLAVAMTFVLPLSGQEKKSSTDMLDQIIQHPGSYSQVCDVMMSPADVPYRAYEVTSFAGAEFSKANLAAMKANRESLVKALRKRLLEIDFQRKPIEVVKDPSPEENFDGDEIGCDPHVLNPLLLELILETKATEALPELLVLEEKLVKGIAATKNDVKVEPPIVTGWYVAQQDAVYPENESEAQRDRRVNLFQARVAQRDLVMTMGKLLRGAEYQPYRETSLEKAYEKGLLAAAKEGGFEGYKLGDPLPAGKEHLVLEIDSFTKIPREDFLEVKVPYSRESRDEVRAVVSKWISEH